MERKLQFEIPCEYVSDSLCLVEEYSQSLPEGAEIKYYNKTKIGFDEYLMIGRSLEINHESKGDFLYDAFFKITGHQIDYKRLERIAENIKDEIEILTKTK